MKRDEKSVLHLPGPAEEEREMVERINWFSKFSLRERLEIGYQHTLAALKLSRMGRKKKGD
jgi:t-SNARE complex subunit (syntaxin)